MPKLDPRFDEFYFGDYLYDAVREEERHFRAQYDPTRGRFAAIRAELIFVFPVTSLFCHLAAAYDAFGFDRTEDSPESILNRGFGWWLQRYLQRQFRNITFMTWDQGGLEDWDYAIVGIPDAVFLTIRTRRRVLVDYKKRLDWPFKMMTRRGIESNLQKTRFYPPKRTDWKQMQLLLYLLRRNGIEEYEGQPIRYAVIISADPGFRIKHSLVAYDEKWVEKELERVKELRDACLEIKIKAGDDSAKVKALIENDPRIRQLPLPYEEHAWCGFRNICPVGKLYQAVVRKGEHKTPEWIKAKHRREAKLRTHQLPTEIQRESDLASPQQVFLLDPKDPGAIQIKDHRKARVVRLGGLPTDRSRQGS